MLARVTGAGPHNRYLHADAVEIRRPAAGRRVAPCPAFRPGGCGGCDWLHATPEVSRELKQAVVVEAFHRFGPHPAPPAQQLAPIAVEPSDLGWRTRTNLAVDATGRAGLRIHHSREVVELEACPQLTDPAAGGAFARMWDPGCAPRWVSPRVGAPVLGVDLRGSVCETVNPAELSAGEGTLRGRSVELQVAVDGFWQAHTGAAEALTRQVGQFLQTRAGERVVDLYAGVGLFGLTLLAAEPTLRVALVEGDRAASRLSARNAKNVGQRRATVVCAPVEQWVRRAESLVGVQAVVLDPPRKGAGKAVLDRIAAAGPERICYVACDPVALARDAATLALRGYSMTDIAVFDLFPNTKHIESVALFTPTTG